VDANTNGIWLYVGEGAGPTWETTGNYSEDSNGINYPDILGISSVQLNTATNPLSFYAYIYNLASSTLHKNFLGQYYVTGNGVTASNDFEAYWSNDTNPLTGVELVPTAGTISSGTCSLYGMN
jgi:hypothetical protein